jgi:hypothetical protein
MKNPLTQECKTGFAVHHTSDEFNSGHLTFDLSIAVDKRESSQDSRFVLL